jgi:hypothetical protein
MGELSELEAWNKRHQNGAAAGSLACWLVPWLLAVVFQSFFERYVLLGGLLVFGSLAGLFWIPEKVGDIWAGPAPQPPKAQHPTPKHVKSTEPSASKPNAAPVPPPPWSDAWRFDLPNSVVLWIARSGMRAWVSCEGSDKLYPAETADIMKYWKVHEIITDDPAFKERSAELLDQLRWHFSFVVMNHLRERSGFREKDSREITYGLKAAIDHRLRKDGLSKQNLK